MPLGRGDRDAEGIRIGEREWRDVVGEAVIAVKPRRPRVGKMCED
jgi:hypothetical protein